VTLRFENDIYKKIHDTVINKYWLFQDQTQVFFSGSQQLYMPN